MHLNDLLHCNDEQFVVNCYHFILGREPDGDGFADHITALRSGRSRLKVVRGFVRSREGRTRGEKVVGLRAALFWRYIPKVRWIEAIWRACSWAGDSDFLLRRVRVLEEVAGTLLYLASQEEAEDELNRRRGPRVSGDAARSLSPRALEIFEELRG